MKRNACKGRRRYYLQNMKTLYNIRLLNETTEKSVQEKLLKSENKVLKEYFETMYRQQNQLRLLAFGDTRR